MNSPNRNQIEVYVEDTDSLIDLVRAVVDDLQSATQRTDWKHKEAQLKEVSSAISKLERMNIEIPDDLRRLKMGLVGELAIREEAEQRLEVLGKAFADLTQELGQKGAGTTPRPSKVRNPNSGGIRKPKKERTSASELRQVMLAALKDLGGSAHCREVLNLMEQKLDGRLKPGDFEFRKSGETVWQNNVRWERNRMVTEGILKNNSPLGYWELNEAIKGGTV